MKVSIDSPFSSSGFSPYMIFDSSEWSQFRADTLLTLTESEVERLRSLNDPISLDEVEKVYLSLSRLLSSHVESAQGLYSERMEFLSKTSVKTPFILGIAGSVAVGKSTTARILRELLSRWSSSPKVDLLTTDGFLLPNAELEQRGLMDRKGFPESFDRRRLLDVLSQVKAGASKIEVPVYSHLAYDVVPDETILIDRPDILIVEGINVLQVSDLPSDGESVPFVSDYFDFSIYLDASEDHLRNWYIDRFLRLQDTAFKDEKSFFHRYADIPKSDAMSIADDLWRRINLENLHQNILPTRLRADVVLHKGSDHSVDWVALRRL